MDIVKQIIDIGQVYAGVPQYLSEKDIVRSHKQQVHEVQVRSPNEVRVFIFIFISSKVKKTAQTKKKDKCTEKLSM